MRQAHWKDREDHCGAGVGLFWRHFVWRPTNSWIQRPETQITYQIDKILITDLPIRIVVCQGQEHFQLVGVQFRAMSLEKIPKLLSADVACVFRVKLKERQRWKWKSEWCVEYSAQHLLMNAYRSVTVLQFHLSFPICIICHRLQS